jgi:hypothetical protein
MLHIIKIVFDIASRNSNPNVTKRTDIGKELIIEGISHK